MTTTLIAGDRWLLEEGTGNWQLEEGSGGATVPNSLWALENLTADLSSYLLHGSLTVKVNTADLAFLDPPAGSLALNAGLHITGPKWDGSMAAITSSDVVDLRNNHVIYSLTATNANTLPTDTAPFDLSDVPGGSLADYTLEDGSGSYELEDGTDWAPGTYQLEGALSQGYSHLSVQKNVIPNAAPKTLGRCTIVTPGLRPGNQFALTSLNQGYAGSAFQVTQVTTRWPALSTAPFFDIEFGDTPATLAAWSLAQIPAVSLPPPPVVIPSGPVIFGTCFVTAGAYAQGGGIVTVASATFSVSVPSGHSLTCQVVGQFLGHMIAWDNYIATPRRAVRGLLSGGVFTGAWQELPFGLTPMSFDVGSAPGLALAAGTYTVSIQIDTQEFNTMVVDAGWIQVAVTTV